jgi:hypothetical protein
MDNEIDYSKHTEPELVDMFSRLDPRYAPAECIRLARFLTERGYIVADGTTGPGSAAPSPEKLEKLIGSTSPFECEVEFSPNKGSLGFIGWTRNQFGFIGSGTLVTDGIYVWISGQVSRDRPLMTMVERNTRLACSQIANVESVDRVVRFEYDVVEVCGDSISLWLVDATTAARLVGVLPGRRTKDFRPQLSR